MTAAAIAQQERPVCSLMVAGASWSLLLLRQHQTRRGRRAPPPSRAPPSARNHGTYPRTTHSSTFTGTCHSCTSTSPAARDTIPVQDCARVPDPTRLARITQAGLLSIRRRSLIPACTHPLTALKTAPRPGVQGGGWLREALVVLRLFHGRLHLGAPTAHPALLTLNLLSVGLAFTLSTSVRPLRAKLRRPRYCIIHPHPRRLRPGLLDRILRPPPRPQ
jgi:hypothetical protein